MAWLPDIKQRILGALATGPLNQFDLADELDEPAFRIRSELMGLKREKFVRATYERSQIGWRLTDRGARAAEDYLQNQFSLWGRDGGS